jgi:Tfp pilus assembly protein PilZ
MAVSKSERRHFRGKARPGRRVELRYRVVENGLIADEQTAYTKNIGVGGAFIFTPDPAPPGATLYIALQMASSERPIEVRGNVRWIVDGQHDEPVREHGMGVKFNGLAVEQLMELNDYFSSLTEVADIDDA